MEEIRAVNAIDQLRKIALGVKKAKTLNQILAMLESW
jgi:hypothetical protein